MMYQVDTELSAETLGRIIRKFQLNELPKIKKAFNYYEGKQNILYRQPVDIGRPCSKVVVNYCSNIAQNYAGYLTGKAITYSTDNEHLQDILNYNDVIQEDNRLLMDALVAGVAYEICYVDEDGKQRFRTLDPREVIPVYDTTLSQNLLYVIRFYKEVLEEKITENYVVEVYGNDSTKVYRSNVGFSSFEFIEERENYYKQVPITVFPLNKDEAPIFSQIYSLQDAYNTLLSDEIDDFEAFCQSYLLLKGVQLDKEDIDVMKEKKCLMIDVDASAEYLTKNISDTQIENMLQNIKDQIHKIAASPDFTDEKFMAQSGVAIQYKLVGFENIAASIETNMRKALQKRVELLCDLMALVSTEEIWRDIEIVFTRNLPADITTAATVIAQLQGIVSHKTLLSLLPFVKDVNEELAAIQEENEAKTALYMNVFNNNKNEGGEEE